MTQYSPPVASDNPGFYWSKCAICNYWIKQDDDVVGGIHAECVEYDKLQREMERMTK